MPLPAAPAVMTCEQLEAMFRSAIASDGDVLTRWADELARRMWAQTPTPSATPRSIGSPAYCASAARSYGGSAASTAARNSPNGSCPASPDRRWRSQQHPHSPDPLLIRHHHHHLPHHPHHHQQHTSSSSHGGHFGQQLPHGRSRLGCRSSGGGAPLATSGPPTASGMAGAPDALLQVQPTPAAGAVLYDTAIAPLTAAAAPGLEEVGAGGAGGQALAHAGALRAPLPPWQQQLEPDAGTGDPGLESAAVAAIAMHAAVGAAIPHLEAGGDVAAWESMAQGVVELPAEVAAAAQSLPWPALAGPAASSATSAPASPARRELPAQVVEEVKRRYLEGCGPHVLTAKPAAAAAAAAMTPRHASLSMAPAPDMATSVGAPVEQYVLTVPVPAASGAVAEPELLSTAFDPACWPAEAAFSLEAFGAEPVGAPEEACAGDGPASFAAMLPPPPQARRASGTYSAVVEADGAGAAPGAPASGAAASVAVALLRGLRAGMPAPPLSRRRGQAAAGRQDGAVEADSEGSEEDEEAWELCPQELFRPAQQVSREEEAAAGSVAAQKAPLLQPSQSSAASCASPSASSYSFGSATTSSYSRGYFTLPSSCTHDNSCFPPASPHGMTADGHVHTAASYYATPASSSSLRKSDGYVTGTVGSSSGNGLRGSGSSPVGKGVAAQDAMFGAWVSAASP